MAFQNSKNTLALLILTKLSLLNVKLSEKTPKNTFSTLLPPLETLQIYLSSQNFGPPRLLKPPLLFCTRE